MSEIIEPFRIKVVEPIRRTTPEERAEILRKAQYNTFLIDADDVLIDLLTASGTSAMSAAQWGGLILLRDAASANHIYGKKNEKHFFGIVFGGEPGAPDTVFYKEFVRF